MIADLSNLFPPRLGLLWRRSLWVFPRIFTMIWFVSPAIAEDGETFFESEIRPVLANRCVACHGPDRKEGGRRLDSREAIGELAETGLLMKVIRGESVAPVSCVLEQRLSEAFFRWISLGLPWPEKATVASPEDRADLARRHWAFQPVREPAVPDETMNPLDAFVAAGRVPAGLVRSPEADRRTLLRRLSYTLTGLPPSHAEISQFVNDPDPEAYEHLVDRLLASPHYGEHWARHWLDVARYSDTKGYVYAREEKNWPHAWTYRDWVVSALNEDMPYDRFLLLQLAADQVPDRRPGDEAAMGFLTMGRRFLGVKHEIIDDRIDVVTRGMLGLTVGCARCHDHKYDPIPAADYYALHGVFDSSMEKLVPLSGGDESFQKAYRDRVKQLDETMGRFRNEATDRVRERLVDYLKAQTELDKYPADGFDQVFQKSDLLPAFVHAWRDFLRNAAERHDPIFAFWHAYAALPEDGFAAAAVRIGDTVTAKTHPTIARVFSTPPASFDEVITRYGSVFHDIDGKWKAALAEAKKAKVPPPTTLEDPEAESLRKVLYGYESPCEVPEGPVVNVETFFDTATINELWKLENEIARSMLNHPVAIPAALTLVDRALPTEPRILLRGNPLTLGATVPRQFLEILSGKDRHPFQIGSGRLELAQAIIAPENPLTARVLVNRVWAHHFGAGLVNTPSDFGTRAEPPSHPELLDWLATKLVQDGWSLKALHRRILTSATYRQSSLGPGDGEARQRDRTADPANRLLWRMNPHRLGYEEFRDSMMAVSGDLDRRVGGKPVDALKAPYSRRRALYGKVDRQFVPGVLRMFDFANPDLHIPQRNETTVPQQALFFLNHPLVLARARAVAKVAGDSNSLSERVRALFRMTVQRDPSDTEIAESLALAEAAVDLSLPFAPATAADWSYGYGAMDEKTQRISAFTKLPYFTNGAWQGGPAVPDPRLGWVYLNASGGHPGNDKDHAAIRRWTSPQRMTLSIQSRFTHEPAGGDGIRGFIVSSRVGFLGSAVIRGKSMDLNVATLAVEAGETIDFVVDIGDGLNSDQFLWKIDLKVAPEDPERPGKAWNADSDFPVDQTTPLTAWEQLAQALLCSNEFLFVD